MTRAFVVQSDFSAGELDPRLLGRTDLRAYQNGAAELRNVVVETTGGVRRRPGTRYLATAAGAGRLVGLETGPGLAYLLVFTDLQIAIYRDGVLKTTVVAPWTEAELAEIVWAQSGSSLLITHPDVPPQQLTRESDTIWTIGQWQFVELASQATLEPFARFAAADVTMQSSAATGTVTITTSAPVFVAEHLGVTVRIAGLQVRLTTIQTSTQAIGLVLETLTDLGPTTDWDEQAFSAARGYPRTVSFHQNRMVIGGSRDLPNAIWLSRTGDSFNFDLGTGLADEAIGFALAANATPTIRALVSSRQLQVFTSVGEWIVSGTPLTPENIQVQQQSQVGTPSDRQVPPRDVDGATLFVARNDRELREFVFTDTEQAYQANDLALLARHLLAAPVDQVFDRRRRLFVVVNGDGTLATIAIFRNADIAAWSLQRTDGQVLSAAVAGGETLLLVERANGVFVEQLDDDLMVDAGLEMSSVDLTQTWAGFGHLEGQELSVIADGLVVEPVTVTGGQITLANGAREITAGLPYTHSIEPMPPVLQSVRTGGQDPVYRPVRVIVRLFETQSLRIDTGDGLGNVPLSTIGGGPKDRTPDPFTGDRALRALGWRRGTDQPPWRIEQDIPLPCTVLSVTTEVKVN